MTDLLDQGGYPWKNFFKELSLQQANQLRIALITIAVALMAFLSEGIDNNTTFEKHSYLNISVIASSLSVASGLLAWKFSSKMFYDTGDGIKKGLNHDLKIIFDYALALLLIASFVMTSMYCVYERELSHNKRIQSTAEMCGD